MEEKIKKVLDDYYILNKLKYEKNSKYNLNNNSTTIASKIFGSSMVAIILCSDLFKGADFGEVIKNIFLKEINDKLDIQLNKNANGDIIAEVATSIEDDYTNTLAILKMFNLKTANNIFDFYVRSNKLKTTVRTGWIYWNVLKEDLEKISEHVYGTYVLALLMSRLDKSIDIDKVLKMLILHETEEIIIGDITVFDKSNKTKEEKGHTAIKELFKDFSNKDELISLLLEFDEKGTKEAKFAYMCDKLEADLQATAYEKMGYNHMDNQDNNPAYKSPKVQEIIRNGASTVAEIWCKFDEDKFNDDENFSKVLKYSMKQKKES